MTKLALLDRDPGRRAGVCYELAQHGIHVDPYESIAELRPTVGGARAILTWFAPGSVTRLLNHLGETNCWLPIIAYSEEPTLGMVVKAMHEGADDFLSGAPIMQKVSRALAGLGGPGQSFGCQKARRRSARLRLQSLSRRESEVLALVAMGHSSKDIGEKLDISNRTVEIHRANLVRKLKVESTIDAVRIAFEAGITDDP